MRRPLAALACGLAAAALAAQPPQQAATQGPAARVQAYFTPGDDVVAVIAGRIGAASRSVQVQAYLFTHRGIAAALARAARRGVKVEIVADAKQHEAGGLPVLAGLASAGARVWLASEYAALHNKVVLVDAGTSSPVVLTGSFNFTRAAQGSAARVQAYFTPGDDVAAVIASSSSNRTCPMRS